MSGSKLPRELSRLINQLAGNGAHGRGEFRRAYQQEKAKLLAQVVVWFAQGKALEDVTADLRARKRLIDARESVKKSINELRRQIMEKTP